MKTRQAILFLMLPLVFTACSVTSRPGSLREEVTFKNPFGSSPASQPSSTAPSSSASSETSPPASPLGSSPPPPGATIPPAQERSINITGEGKGKESSTAELLKAGKLPSMSGTIKTGLIGPKGEKRSKTAPFPTGETKQKIVLNFEKADISEVTNQIFGDYLKLNYVLDPSLQGRISFYLEGEYNRDELLLMVTKAYAANNVSIIPKNGVYYIQPVQRSSSSGLPIADSITLQDYKDIVNPVIVLYRLSFVDAKQAINTVRFFLSPGRPITADSLTNTVVFAEDADNARTVVDILRALDVNVLQEVSMEIVPLKSMSPQDAAQGMEALMSKMGAFKDSAIKNNVAFIPLQNFGGVLVLAQNPELLKTVKYWLTALDVQGHESGEQIYVYFVQNSLAADISDILTQVFGLKAATTEKRPEQQIVKSTKSGFGSSFGSSFGGGSSGSSFGGSSGSSAFGGSSGSTMGGSSSTTGRGAFASGSGGAFGQQTKGKAATRTTSGASMATSLTGEVVILADEVNNAIVVRANAADYTKIKKTIETLDILPRAVLIEVMIAEITLTKDLQYGLEWFVRNQGSFNAGFGGGPASPEFDFSKSLGNSGMSLLWGGAASQFATLINLIASKTDVNVLSTPTLLATDNKEASITVGGREPVPTGSYATSGTSNVSDVFSTIQYEETGIILNVTPHINAGGLVRLEVEQTIRRTDPQTVTVGAGNTAPRFTERDVKTTLLAQNGNTVVIGGIIEETHTDNKNGIPFLQDIPIISPLFTSNKERKLERTELIIAITPHVVEHHETDATREFLEKLKSLKKRIQQ